jgi:type IV fimbrial biogenesis protein FimT
LLPARSAFSLVELCLVLLIISVMAGLAMPRMSASRDRHRVEAIARRLSTDLERARTLAQAEQREWVLVTKSGADAYELYPPLNPASGERVLLDLTKPDTQIVSIDFNDSNAASFSPFGTPVSGGFIDVASGSMLVRITVDAVTGRVTRSAPRARLTAERVPVISLRLLSLGEVTIEDPG